MPKRKLGHDGWIVVADGAKALFLRNEGDRQHPNLKVFWERKQENPPTHEQGTDRQGRFPDNSAHHRSATQETDWHQQEEERFAADIAERLYKHAQKGEFDELIVVAPPQTLAVLRGKFHAEVNERIVAEVDKDLTNHPVHEIEKNILGR